MSNVPVIVLASMAVLVGLALPTVAASRSGSTTDLPESSPALVESTTTAPTGDKLPSNGSCPANSVSSPSPALPTLYSVVGSDQGLPGNQISGLVEDAQGYLWISSFGGLIRWDGEKSIQVGGAEWTEQLPQVSVTALLADPTDGVWALASDLVKVSSRGIVTKMGVNGVSLAPASKGRLWVGTTDSVSLFDMKTEKVIRTISFATTDKKSPLSAAIDGISSDRDGNVGILDTDLRFRVVSPEGRTRFLTTNGRYADVAGDGTIAADLLSNVSNAVLREAGGFWIVTPEGGVAGYDGTRVYPTPADAAINQASTVIALYEVPAGRPNGKLRAGDLLAASDGWIKRLPAGGSRWLDVQAGFPTPDVKTPMVDSRGILWFADWQRGAVAVMPSDRGAGGWYPGGGAAGQVVPTLDVILRGDEVWTASDGYGLYILNRRTGSFRMMGTPGLLSTAGKRQAAAETLQDPDTSSRTGVATGTGTLPSDAAIGLACVGDKVWLGMWDGGISIIDPATLGVTQLRSPDQALSGAAPVLASRNIFDITTDADGNAWASA